MTLRKRIAKRKFTEPRMIGLLTELRKNKTGFWQSVGKRLSTPRKNRVSVNLAKLDRLAGKETLVVPGKVLASGDLSKKITIAAYNFSEKAIEKISAAGGTALSLEDTLKKNPEGKKVKMVI
ncbi:MAG: 50S ribosomal protein L18e [Candidatus Altiarchaeota archaeon]|nr:50S ribosomal protein L18e [Candidatus Altiarchaeota archaeon]